MSRTDEAQGTVDHRSEGDNARVSVKISLKPRFGKDDLKARYKVEKYNLSEGFSMGTSLQALVPKGTPSYVEHGENYVERIMRALYHFKQCALIGPSGTGKSVCAGEPVFVSLNGGLKLTTVDGLFDELGRRYPTMMDADGWEVLPLTGANIRILSMEPGAGELVWRHPSALARSIYKGKVVQVTTRRNRVVRATPDHSFIVEGRSKKASEVRVGARIPIARHVPMHSDTPLEAVQIADYVPGAVLAEGRVVGAPEGGLQISAPPSIDLDEDFAWFLGFFVAEGYVGKGFASVYNQDGALVERCNLTARSLGLSASIRRQRGLTETRIFSKAFVSFLSASTLSRRVGSGKGSQARYKKVPDFVYSMKESSKVAFLEGFFMGDGWEEEHSKIVLGTSSVDLANGLVILCEQLGIFPTLRVKKGTNASYGIAMARDGAAKLGIRISGLKDRTDHRGHVENMTVTHEMLDLAKSAYRRLPEDEKSKGLHKRTVSTFYPVGKKIGMGLLGKIAAEISSPDLARTAESDVLWDEVKKVDYLDYSGWVYDFQVPGTETFMAGLGGIVTHNTHVTYLVAELAGLPLWEINCGLQTSVYDLFGRFVGLGKENWVDGQIVSWCRYGGILYLDEANMMKQDIATRLNPILDTRGHMVLNERDNEVIPRHPNGYVIISMNPYSAEFAGTKPLNAAFRRRMTVWIDFDYLSVGSKIAPDEVEMIAQRAKIDRSVAEKLVRVAAEVRRQYKAGDLPYAPSVGDLVNWGTLVADGLTPAAAAEETIVALTADDPEVQNSVRRVVRMVVGDK